MASSNDDKKPSGAGLSAFASLLDPNSKSISAAPVSYKQEEDAEKKEEKSVSSTSLAFKPVKRPQVKQPPKPRPGTVISKPPTLYKQDSAPKAVVENNNNGGEAKVPADSDSTAQQGNNYKPTLQDWMDTMPEDEDAVAAYQAAKHQSRASGKAARKRKREDMQRAREQEESELTRWKAPYDPSKPNRYQLFRGSDEFYDMVDEWKEFLHSRARATGRTRRLHSPGGRKQADVARNPAFAPPSGMSFAPPAIYDEDRKVEKGDDEDEPYEPPPPPPAAVPNHAMGDEAYAQRMALSGGIPPPPPPAAPAPTVQEDEEMDDYEPPPPPVSAPPAPAPGTISREPVRYEVPAPQAQAPGTISREPVRYDNTSPNVPDVPMDDVKDERPAENVPQPSSKRPGQKDFAKRMMEKMGWQKGSGLGAQGTGIATPLSVQLNKRLKRSNNEGGGFVGPAGTGRIVGGQLSKEGKAAQKRAAEEAERVGELSEVVAFDHILDGQDLDKVIVELNFYQAFGDECGEKFGRVERVFVQRQGPDEGRVFVKFTDKMSAMRALQAYEGSRYGGNDIVARYFSTEKFEKDVMCI